MTDRTTRDEREAIEDGGFRHVDDEGYHCGGPHYPAPDSEWVWCEPSHVWVTQR